MLVLLGLRGLDRRVKLRVGPAGLFYATWGSQTFLWDEFEGSAPFQRKNLSWIEVRAKYPERLRSRLSLSARVDAWINARLARPPVYINPGQLDVPASDILAALRRYQPTR